MAGQWIDIAAADGGTFKGYLDRSGIGLGSRHPAAAGDLRRQYLDARGRRLLRRGRLCRAGAGPVLAPGAGHRARLLRGRLQQGVRLLPALRRQSVDQGRRRRAEGAAGAPGMRRQGRRARLLPRRQARLSRRGAHRCRLRRLLLRRRHRGRPRRGRATSRARWCFTSPSSTSSRRPEAREQIKAAFARPSRCRVLSLSRLRSRLRRAGARELQQAGDPDGAFALDRAVPQSAGPALRSLRAVGPAHRAGIRHAVGRSDHGDHGGRALRQPHPDHDRRRRLPRPPALLQEPFHSEDAAGHQADPDLAHHRRRSHRRRDAVLLHPRHRDRLDAARRGADRQICRDPAGRDRPLPRRQALQRAHLLGSGLGAGADRAARSGEAAGRRRRDGEEARRRERCRRTR